MGRGETHSPLLTLLIPKLLPTTPIQRHVFPAAFVQVAVAGAPTLRHVMSRFSTESMGEADASTARNAARETVVAFIVGGGG